MIMKYPPIRNQSLIAVLHEGKWIQAILTEIVDGGVRAEIDTPDNWDEGWTTFFKDGDWGLLW
jgi:hypothetical protein